MESFIFRDYSLFYFNTHIHYLHTKTSQASPSYIKYSFLNWICIIASICLRHTWRFLNDFTNLFLTCSNFMCILMWKRMQKTDGNFIKWQLNVVSLRLNIFITSWIRPQTRWSGGRLANSHAVKCSSMKPERILYIHCIITVTFSNAQCKLLSRRRILRSQENVCPESWGFWLIMPWDFRLLGEYPLRFRFLHCVLLVSPLQPIYKILSFPVPGNSV